jgi:hypothetical protein
MILYWIILDNSIRFFLALFNTISIHSSLSLFIQWVCVLSCMQYIYYRPTLSYIRICSPGMVVYILQQQIKSSPLMVENQKQTKVGRKHVAKEAPAPSACSTCVPSLKLVHAHFCGSIRHVDLVGSLPFIASWVCLDTDKRRMPQNFLVYHHLNGG